MLFFHGSLCHSPGRNAHFRWLEKFVPAPPKFLQARKRFLISYQTNRFYSNHLGRISSLQALTKEIYPRYTTKTSEISCRNFIKYYRESSSLSLNEIEDPVVLKGRITAKRTAGTRLIFVDIVENDQRVQALCNFRNLEAVKFQDFKTTFNILQKGDIVQLRGYPRKTQSGELSLSLCSLPELLSPCLHALPAELHDAETRIRNRHVDFLVNPKSIQLIKAKSEVIQCMRNFLLRDGQIEVQTPILAELASGADARPFITSATEFSKRKLSLRIAPELWLKRLAIGGFERVFEIGPSFRNEGIDLAHNPEFTTCEFYRAYTDLNDLMRLTENLFVDLSKAVTGARETRLTSLPAPRIPLSLPFKVLDFIPEIEKALGRSLPNLTDPFAVSDLVRILEDYSIPVPVDPSLSKLLDKLSAAFLEPKCSEPTFIIQHPECMSPLSKSFIHPTATHQKVAARAELFVHGQELANMYEEENSPVEQRRKFVDQQRSGEEERDTADIDEQYLHALEWGLPPTGGWGCGIERVCMVLLGTNRIGETLSFGTLRNVIAK